MSVSLTKGANISLSKEAPGLRTAKVGLGWDARSNSGAAFDLDAVAFVLGKDGRVRADNDFVFYNNLRSSDGAIEHTGDNRKGAGAADAESIRVDVTRLSPTADRVVFAVTIHDAEARRQHFGMVANAFIRVVDDANGSEVARYDLLDRTGLETAMIFGELYRHGPDWKFRAVGQGFAGGLAPLATSFGVDAPQGGSRGASNAHSQTEPSAAPPARVNLSKVTLEKGKPVTLTKRDDLVGEITVNLNWNRAQETRRGLSGLFGGGTQARGIDLDLGCLFEMSSGEAGVVQALGNAWGSLHSPPYILLGGDDRTGDQSEGEFLYINGQHIDSLRRVLIFAFIYAGIPNWASADGVVTLAVPGEPELEVRLDEARSDRIMCAIAMIESKQRTLRVSKLVEYFGGHSDMDKKYGFGLSWRHGTKD